MIFLYNWLQSFFDKSLPKPDKLAEILTLHAFEVDGIEKSGKDFLLNVDILPNRAHDCMSHLGMAREIAAITKLKIKYKKPEIKIKNIKTGGLAVKIEDKNLCPRYIGVMINDVKIGPSPKWLKERLESLGQKSINNIVDATNYVMFETGQPLHAFDADKIGGGIIVRRGMAGENITTLDGEKIELNNDILVIADGESPLAIAGIKGGKKAEITNQTKNIILEAANFNASNIRRASKKIGIITDSSTRFAADICPCMAERGMGRLIEIILDVAGGKTSAYADIYLKKPAPVRVLFRTEKANALLGANIKEKEMIDILERIGCEARGGKKKGEFIVFPPSRRLDLRLEEDLIEDVGRIYGYDKISPIPPLIEMILPSKNNLLLYRERARDMLKGLGFSEVYNYSFVGARELDIFGRSEHNFFELANPSKPEFSYMRPALISGLCDNVKENAKRAEGLKFFEIGKIYRDGEEREMLALVVRDGGDESKDAFFKIKGELSSLFESFGVSAWFDDAPKGVHEYRGVGNFLHPFQRAQVKVDGEILGVLGSIHPEVARAYKIKGGVGLCEIDFEKAARLFARENEYLAPSKYPAVTRDVAVMVPVHTKAASVLDVIESQGGKLLIDVDLFDMYEGEELPDGQKSFAFHLIFQSAERTLTDKEIDDIMVRITQALEEKDEWEVRR